MARRLAWVVIGAVLLTALFANCLAADRPIVLHLDGETYWFPNLVHYEELTDLRGHALRERMGEDDWAVWTPVRCNWSTTLITACRAPTKPGPIAFSSFAPMASWP